MASKTNNKENLAKVFEHFCNDKVEDATELFHKVIVEMSRDIHSQLVAEEDAAHDDALETDMESDLADDLDAIHGPEGEGEGLEHHAEENLGDDILDNEDDLSADGEDVDGEDEFGLDDGEGEFESPEEAEHEEEHEEEVDTRLEDLEDNFEELKRMFAELSDEESGEEVKEGVELDKVSVKKSGEVGEGTSTGMGSGEKAKSPFSNSQNKINIGGEAVAIGKGPTHTGYERETAPTSKEFPKMVNRVKSSREVLKPVGKQPATGEVGSGKSGMPVEGNVTSIIGSKK